MMNGFHAWEFISGFQRRLQDVSFRIVAAMLVWSGLSSCMRPHIVFALEPEGAATKSSNIFKNFIVSCTLCANGTSSISFPSRFSYLIFSAVFSFFFMHACVLWCFPKVRTHAESGADLGGGCRGCAPPLPTYEMTCGFLIQLAFCKKNYVVYWCWSRARDECTPS